MLEGHTDEIFSCSFNYEGDVIITGIKKNKNFSGSKDNSCKIWRDSLVYNNKWNKLINI